MRACTVPRCQSSSTRVFPERDAGTRAVLPSSRGGQRHARHDMVSGVRSRPEPPQSVLGARARVPGGGEGGRGDPLETKRRYVVLAHQLQPVPLIADAVKCERAQLRLELLKPHEVSEAQVLPVEEQHRQVLLHDGIPPPLRGGSLTRLSRRWAARPLPRGGGGLRLLLRRGRPPVWWLPVERHNKSQQRSAVGREGGGGAHLGRPSVISDQVPNECRTARRTNAAGACWPAGRARVDSTSRRPTSGRGDL